jgi:hypothetical protein
MSAPSPSCSLPSSRSPLTRTRHLADTIAPRPLPPSLCEPHTISCQKSSIKSDIIDKWGKRWRDDERTSHAYIALTTPPTGNPPPVIMGAKGCECVVFLTLIRFITRRAFVGAYSTRFHPDQPVGCPCGAAFQTVEHVVSFHPLHAHTD